MEMNLNWLIDGMRADKAKNDGGKPAGLWRNENLKGGHETHYAR